MGYYSDFKIWVVDADPYTENYIPVAEELNEISGYYFDSHVDNEAAACEVKWYDHREDMRFFTQRHPDVTFGFLRDGEDTDDAERYDMKNGVKVKTYSRSWIAD